VVKDRDLVRLFSDSYIPRPFAQRELASKRRAAKQVVHLESTALFRNVPRRDWPRVRRLVLREHLPIDPILLGRRSAANRHFLRRRQTPASGIIRRYIVPETLGALQTSSDDRQVVRGGATRKQPAFNRNRAGLGNGVDRAQGCSTLRANLFGH
jgi:hypothetical protein